MLPRSKSCLRAAANGRGRVTVLAVAFVALVLGVVATLLGHDEAIGLAVIALLMVAAEVVAAVSTPRDDTDPDHGDHR